MQRPATALRSVLELHVRDFPAKFVASVSTKVTLQPPGLRILRLLLLSPVPPLRVCQRPTGNPP